MAVPQLVPAAESFPFVATNQSAASAGPAARNSAQIQRTLFRILFMATFSSRKDSSIQ